MRKENQIFQSLVREQESLIGNSGVEEKVNPKKSAPKTVTVLGIEHDIPNCPYDHSHKMEVRKTVPNSLLVKWDSLYFIDTTPEGVGYFFGCDTCGKN